MLEGRGLISVEIRRKESLLCKDNGGCDMARLGFGELEERKRGKKEKEKGGKKRRKNGGGNLRWEARIRAVGSTNVIPLGLYMYPSVTMASA